MLSNFFRWEIWIWTYPCEADSLHQDMRDEFTFKESSTFSFQSLNKWNLEISCLRMLMIFNPVRLFSHQAFQNIAAAATAKLLQSCLTLCAKSLQSCPHRRQPTRLFHPWDSPGKNGCAEWADIVRAVMLQFPELNAQKSYQEEMDICVSFSVLHIGDGEGGGRGDQDGEYM